MGILDFFKKSKKPNSGKTTETDSSNVDFSALVKEARDTGNKEDEIKLWREVYKLDEWYAVARGELPDIHPFIGIVDDKPFIIAFTDGRKAFDFAKQQGFIDKDGKSQILSLPVIGVIENVQSYIDDDVFGILFNSGPDGFYAPLSNLLPMAYYYGLIKDEDE